MTDGRATGPADGTTHAMNEITLLVVEETELAGKRIPPGSLIVWRLDVPTEVLSVVINLPNDPGALLNPLFDGKIQDVTGRSSSLLAQRIQAIVGASSRHAAPHPPPTLPAGSRRLQLLR